MERSLGLRRPLELAVVMRGSVMQEAKPARSLLQSWQRGAACHVQLVVWLRAESCSSPCIPLPSIGSVSSILYRWRAGMPLVEGGCRLVLVTASKNRALLALPLSVFKEGLKESIQIPGSLVPPCVAGMGWASSLSWCWVGMRPNVSCASAKSTR